MLGMEKGAPAVTKPAEVVMPPLGVRDMKPLGVVKATVPLDQLALVSWVASGVPWDGGVKSIWEGELRLVTRVACWAGVSLWADLDSMREMIWRTWVGVR